MEITKVVHGPCRHRCRQAGPGTSDAGAETPGDDHDATTEPPRRRPATRSRLGRRARERHRGPRPGAALRPRDVGRPRDPEPAPGAGLFGGLGAVATVAACGVGGSSAGTSTSSTATADATLTEVPDETGGPFSTTTAQGVPLMIRLTVRRVSTGAALSGAAVYIFHCDREDNYSLHSEAAAGENYLRGFQEADPGGTASFTSVFPAAYPGRWPHVHFELGRGDLLGSDRQDLPDRPSPGGLRRGVRDRRLRRQRDQHATDLPPERQRLRQRRRDPPDRPDVGRRVVRLRRRADHRGLAGVRHLPGAPT